MLSPALIAALIAAMPAINLDPSDCEAVKLSIRDELLGSLRSKGADAGIGSLTLNHHSETGSHWVAMVDLPDESVPYLIDLEPDDPRAFICAEGAGASNVSARGGAASISGHVVTDRGVPLAGSRISAELECCDGCECPWGCACPPASRSRKYEPPLTARTDGAGRFELAGLQRGRYSVWVDKPGYGMEQRKIEAGTPPAVFKFPYRGLVRLRVTANGAPAPDAVAAALSQRDGTPVDAVSGFIELTLPPRQTMKLQVSAAGVYPRIIAVTSQAGAPGAPIEVALSSGRTLTVTVIDDETRQPVPGARVSPWSPELFGRTWGFHDDDWRGLVTGADGVAKFDHFDAANAAVTVDSSQHVLTKVDVPAGRGQVTARLQRGATLFGRVLDGKERPYTNAQVELSRSDYHERRRVTPGRDGSYEIRGLVPGDYSVHTYFDWSGYETMPADAPKLIMHDIRIAGPERVLLDLREAAATLTVTNSDSGSSVQLWRGDVPAPRSLEDTRTRGDTSLSSIGGARLQARQLTAGRYTLRVITRTNQGNAWGVTVDQRRIEIPKTGDIEIVVVQTPQAQFFPCARPGCEPN